MLHIKQVVHLWVESAQHLLAVDRNNARVNHWYQPFHPAVIRALHHIIKESSKTGTPVTLCGELAGDPRGVVLLIAMGYRSLSMSASSLAKVKKTVCSVRLSWCHELLEQVLCCEKSDQIEQAVEQVLKAV
jgi:phosphotransferase system enzyme I (PtsP)